MLIIAIIVIGLAAGWVADMIVNKRSRPNDWSSVLLLGLVGSFVGGLLISLLFGDGLALRPSGLIGSVVGALLVAALMSKFRRTT